MIKALPVLLAVGLASATAAQGQTQTYSASAPQFMPMSSATTYNYDSVGLHLYSTVPGGMFLSEVHPPIGGNINGFEIDACNTSLTAPLTATVFTTDDFGNNTTIVAGPLTVPANSGCGPFEVTITPPVAITDGAHWVVDVETGAGDNTTSFSGVKLTYDLAGFNFAPTPYFADVPASSPIFPFVQKMFELGVTAGCGGGLYCPNSPVTRGQMSVFIVKSVYEGIH